MHASGGLCVRGLAVAALLLITAACGSETRSARSQGGADFVVRDFCRRFGHQQGLAVLSLFADSARFDIEGVGVSFVGREGLTRLAGYGVAVHSRLVVRDIETGRDTV